MQFLLFTAFIELIDGIISVFQLKTASLEIRSSRVSAYNNILSKQNWISIAASGVQS